MDSSGSLSVHPASLRVLGHSSHGREEAVGIGMCLLAAFWDEILCFWCRQETIESSHAQLFELKQRAQAQQRGG